jgi:hypothetical protein
LKHDGLLLSDCPAKAATGMHARLDQCPSPVGAVSWLVTPEGWLAEGVTTNLL